MNTRALNTAVAGQVRRLRLEARGIVQGVGFRPHAYRTALALELAGHVCNHGEGVSIEIEGPRVLEFEKRFCESLPPLARIDSLSISEVPVTGARQFVIQRSAVTSGRATVPADVAICAHCVHELFDTDDRRFLHPFIACCDCGPRYTMARGLPYDRANTSMGEFPLCENCSGEYASPDSRRLHAEPIGCHHCGPTLSHSISQIADALRAGQIVAIKGMGGYHLVCDARSPAAVKRLRERKRRDGRPFAIMVLNTDSARQQLDLDTAAATALASPQRPVVIADRSNRFDLPEGLAPGLSTLGIMLPYTAVHYLLFHALAGSPEGTAWLDADCAAALVMTSANISGEPMLADDTQAAQQLAVVADLIVSHNREITHGCDDSVLRAARGQTIMLRRARGYAPNAVDFGCDAEPILALGAHFKNTICAVRGSDAFLSSHLGDLETPAMHRLINASSRELLDWLRMEPAAIACDLHPDYASTRLAEHMACELDVPVIGVQHHHAHIAAVAAAHRHTEPVIGLALDGHGMGDDGESWGGELLLVEGATSKRLGHLRPLPLPGGDRATREPWRIASAVGAAMGVQQQLPKSIREHSLFDTVVALSGSEACSRTTACGRYFDAASSLLGLCQTATYEAEAPMRLESQCRALRTDRSLYTLANGNLDPYTLLAGLVDCSDATEGSNLFHGTLLSALVEWVEATAQAQGVNTVALGGGCFLNAILARELPDQLRVRGLRVLTGWESLTPGDGSISLGQAWVAGLLLRDGDHQAPKVQRPTTGGIR